MNATRETPHTMAGILPLVPLLSYHVRLRKTFTKLPESGKCCEIAKRVVFVVMAPLAYITLAFIAFAALFCCRGRQPAPSRTQTLGKAIALAEKEIKGIEASPSNGLTLLRQRYILKCSFGKMTEIFEAMDEKERKASDAIIHAMNSWALRQPPQEATATLSGIAFREMGRPDGTKELTEWDFHVVNTNSGRSHSTPNGNVYEWIKASLESVGVGEDEVSNDPFAIQVLYSQLL